MGWCVWVGFVRVSEGVVGAVAIPSGGCLSQKGSCDWGVGGYGRVDGCS